MRISMLAIVVCLLPALPTGATEKGSTQPLLKKTEPGKPAGGFAVPKTPVPTGSTPTKSTVPTLVIPKIPGVPKVQQNPQQMSPAKQTPGIPSWEEVRPRITSVRRVSAPPGPVAVGFFNGELIQVDGANFGNPPRAGFQYGGRVASLMISGGRPPSSTEFAVFMPSRAILERAGIRVPPGRGVSANLVYLSAGGQVLASLPITYVLRSPETDHDGDGVTIGAGDCNDFDPGIYAGNVELADADGRDEDCNPTTFGAVDRDGDGFPDAAMYNVDRRARRIYRGTDCNDADPTANPIRPENCPPGTSPAERDAAVRVF